MPDPYLGEIRYFAGAQAPAHWAFCAGQLLTIQQNQALYSLIGTMYGGDGRTTFALPNLCGRVLVGYSMQNQTFGYGKSGGEEAVTLTDATMPFHDHPCAVQASMGMVASDQPAVRAIPQAGDVLGRGRELTTESPLQNYAPSDAGDTIGLAGVSGSVSGVQVAAAGASQPHENRMPYVVIQAIIALQGVYPSRP